MAHHEGLASSLDGHYNIESTTMMNVSIDRHKRIVQRSVHKCNCTWRSLEGTGDRSDTGCHGHDDALARESDKDFITRWSRAPFKARLRALVGENLPHEFL